MATVTEHLAILVTAQGTQASGEVQKLSGAFGTLSKVQLAAGVVALGFGRIMLDSAKATSAFNEQASASSAIFGPAANGLRQFAEGAASIGLAERAALQGANAIGGMFKEAGASQQEAADLSESMGRLASDLASFRDVAGGSEEVLNKLRSGLTGEVEPLRNLGIFLNDNEVRAKAVQLGLADTHAEVDDGAKILARYNLIIEKTKDAQGNFALTAGELANAQRTANAELENAQKELGEKTIALQIGWTRAKTQILREVQEIAESPGKGIAGSFKAFAFSEIDKKELKDRQKATRSQSEADAKAKEDQDRYAESLSITTGITREARQSEEQLTKAREDASKATKERRNAEESLSDAHKATERAQRDENEAMQDLADLQQRGAVDAEDVARAKERQADASKAVTKAQEDEVDSAKAVAAATAGVAEAQANLERVKAGASARDLQKAELDLRAAKRGQTQATIDQAKAQADVNGLVSIGVVAAGQQVATTQDKEQAQLDLEAANDDVTRSTINTKEAEETLQALRERGKPGSKDLKDAQDELASKTEILNQAVKDQAAAHEDVAVKQRDQVAAGDELKKAEAGDPEFAETLREARQKVADAHDNAARAKRNERDATEELQAALENFTAKVTNVAEQGVGTPLVSTRAVGDQDFRPVVRNAQVAASGGVTNVTVFTGADANAVVRAIKQNEASNGGKPR